MDLAGVGIGVDSAGNAYISGTLEGSDASLPATSGAYQPRHPGGRTGGVVVKLNPAGSAALHVTYLGGTGKSRDRERPFRFH
jgi:hypothetical protein